MDNSSLPAIIGASSALAGVFLSQILAMLRSSTERKSQHKSLMRDKLEELTDNLQKTTGWFDLWFRYYNYISEKGKNEAPGDPPQSSNEARRVYVLSLLYFPDLADSAKEILNALNVIHYAVDDFESRAGQILNAFDKFTKCKNKLEELINEEARKLTV